MKVSSAEGKRGTKGLWLAGGALILMCGVGFVLVQRASTAEGSISRIPTFVVKEGPLLISVVESGTIRAREQQVVKSEVEGQTQILWLIVEGERVEKGDLLVRLDSSDLEDKLLNQQIQVQSAEAEFIDARENLGVMKLTAESTVSAAKLRAQFAAEDLTKYIEGDFPLDLKSAEAQVTLAIAELASAEEDLDGKKRLFEKDFVTARELDRAQRLLQRAQLDLELAESNIELLKGFTYNRRLTQLQSDKEEAGRALERAKLESASWVIQSEGAVKGKTSQFQHQQKKLRKIEEQIVKCEIYAPTGGMVVYATTAKGGGRMGREEPLEEGQMVYERQELIHLPTASSVMAQVAIHESNLAKVHPGLGVRITVDALPGREFTGHVATIAQLPDARSIFMNPDLKVYDTEIYIDGDGGELRTGMSCLARIMVEHYENTVYIPVQSVVLTKAGSVVHVLKGNEIEERLVQVGLDNNRMIRIASNLKAGERVMLAPPAASTAIDDDDLSKTFVEAAAPPKVVDKGLDAAGAYGKDPKGKGAAAKGGEGRRGRMGNMTPEQMQEMRKRYENMPPEDQEEMRQQRRSAMGNMTPEQMQEMRKRYENMSPEDQEKARKQWGGGGVGGMAGTGASNSHGQ